MRSYLEVYLFEEEDEEIDWSLPKYCCYFVTFVALIVIIVIVSCADPRPSLNEQPGYVGPAMSRQVIKQRADYVAKLEKYRIFYWNEAAIEWPDSCAVDQYWNEESQVVLSAEAEADLMKATVELHAMCLEAVDVVVNDASNRLLYLA